MKVWKTKLTGNVELGPLMPPIHFGVERSKVKVTVLLFTKLIYIMIYKLAMINLSTGKYGR